MLVASNRILPNLSENLAQDLPQSCGMSYLFVSHQVARLLGDCVMVMRAEHAENGKNNGR
jgi:ABC-type microcin C transport system duplicated ATPase subunit YejF